AGRGIAREARGRHRPLLHLAGEIGMRARCDAVVRAAGHGKRLACHERRSQYSAEGLRHSGRAAATSAIRNPDGIELNVLWIPACAGMTKRTISAYHTHRFISFIGSSTEESAFAKR